MTTSGKGKGKGPGSGGTPAKNFGGARQLRVSLKTARRRSASSQRWLERQLNDPYVAAAKREGWRSRAAFKLIEIDDKHRILKPGQRIVDLGAAPGGWTQVAAQRVKAAEGRGQVIGIDYLPVDAIAGATILELDFLEDDAPDKLKSLLRDRRADESPPCPDWRADPRRRSWSARSCAHGLRRPAWGRHWRDETPCG